MKKRKDFARAVRAALGSLFFILVNDEAIALVGDGAKKTMPGRVFVMDLEAANCTAEFPEDISLHFLKPAILWREVNPNKQRALHPAQRSLVGRIKGVATIFSDVDISAWYTQTESGEWIRKNDIRRDK